MRPDKAKHPVQDREKSPLCRTAAGLQSVSDQVKVGLHNYKSASRSAFIGFVPRRLTTREGVLAKDGDSPISHGDAIDSTPVRCNHARHSYDYEDSSRMKIYGADNREMMNVTSLERDGAQLVIRGKIFGAMPLTAKLRPEEARAALKLLNFRTAIFLLTLLFRRKIV